MRNAPPCQFRLAHIRNLADLIASMEDCPQRRLLMTALWQVTDLYRTAHPKTEAMLPSLPPRLVIWGTL